MTAPSSLRALTDSLGNSALRGEISWQTAERALQLAEASADQLEEKEEHREWLRYVERVATLEPEYLGPEALWQELNLARASWLTSVQPGWLRGWQRRLQSLLLERQSA